MVIVLIMVPKAPSTFPSSSDLPASPWLCPPVCYSHCRIGKGIYCCLHWFSVTSVRNYRKFIWWLNVTEIHSLTVLEARTPKSVSLGQKSKCQMGCFPSDFLGENLSFVSSSFWRLWMFLTGGHTTPGLVSLVIPPSPLCLCQISSCFLLTQIRVIAHRTHWKIQANPAISKCLR